MIVILCQIRLDSTRLPYKALKKINNIPIALYMINAMNKSYYSNLNAFVIPNKEKDIEIFSKYNINIFTGSEFNLLERYIEAVDKIEILFNKKIKHIVRITGDCPMLNYATGLIDNIISKHILNKNDFTRNRGDCGYPSGFDVEVMTKELLINSYKNHTTEEEKEHITMYVKNRMKDYKIQEIKTNYNIDYNLKWSVDDEESFNRVSDLINLIESGIIKF